MRSEDQRMLIEDAQGQQTVQCLFVQPNPKRQVAKIGNVQFEKTPEGLFAYVYNGTFEGYQAFQRIMAQHGVYPAHEIPGDVAGTAPAENDEPTVNTDPGKTETDTLTDPAEIEADVSIPSSEPASEGEPATGDAGEAGSEPVSDNANGSGPDDASGGDQGGASSGENSTGTVSAQVKPSKAKAKDKPSEADPFAL